MAEKKIEDLAAGDIVEVKRETKQALYLEIKNVAEIHQGMFVEFRVPPGMNISSSDHPSFNLSVLWNESIPEVMLSFVFERGGVVRVR